MGKKSREQMEDGEAVKSLFGTDNPYRRKPQPEVAGCDTGVNTQPTKKVRLEIDYSAAKKETITEDKFSDVEYSDARKGKRDREIIAAALSPRSCDEEPITKKRKKLVVEAEVDGLKNKKDKRKREDVELEYEKRKFGYVGEEKQAANVLAIGEKRKADAAAADMLDTKGPFDDDSKLLRTVFIGNLPLKTKRKALNREFARFGEIESVRIRSVPLVDAKAPRKAAVMKGQINEEVDSMNAYIVFKEEQSAHAALSNNMTQIGGNHIRVDMVCPPRKKMKGVARLYDRKRTVFVGNLPFDVKEAANNAKADTILSKVKEPPSKDFPHGRPAPASSSTPSAKDNKRKRANTASASYEGLRSSKTGVVKKSSFRRSNRISDSGSKNSSWNEEQDRKTKRPAVAARKAKQLQKRKHSGGTPESSRLNKRVRSH